MPFRAPYLLIAVFSVSFSLSANADTETFRAKGESALALDDCTAMREARQLLKPAADQDAESEEAALRNRLADAMLALPDCGESRFQLLRSRSLKSGPGLHPGEGRAQH